MTQSEKISRKDEIRALFIFGLLAVLASIRVQYSQVNVIVGFSSIDIAPYIDFIIGFWSLYAFFMVLGLSGDVIGEKVADSFRRLSTFFLQYSYIILAIFAFPIGFQAYGARFIFPILIIVLVGMIGGVLHLDKKHFSFWKWLKSVSISDISWDIKKRLPLIITTIFFLAGYEMLNYPETGFASFEIPYIAFIVSAVTGAILIVLLSKKEDNSTSDDDTTPVNET